MTKRHPVRTENLRRALAQEAARVMAEHGVRDFLFAKRKAAERFGVTDNAVLPSRRPCSYGEATTRSCPRRSSTRTTARGASGNSVSPRQVTKRPTRTSL